MNKQEVRSVGLKVIGLVTAIMAVLVIAVPRVPGSTCTFSVPLPPSPLPPNFDWSTLATDWCNQLAACGYDTTNCVANYLNTVTNGIPPPVSPPADSSTKSSTADTMTLSCTDSEEYQSGATICLTPPNLPPDCSRAAATPNMLWPPHHEFADVSVTGVTDADGDPVSITITGITQDQPVLGGGSGHSCPDGAGVGSSTASVRAERDGTDLNGRVYTISFMGSDGRGGTCTSTVTVCVPHDQGQHNVCVAKPPAVDSTGPCNQQ